MTSPPAHWHSRRQTLWNAASSWADMICQGLIGLVTVPFLLASLRQDGFGAFCVLNMIIVYGSYIDVGIRSGIGRDLTESVVHNDGKQFTSLLASACIINTGLALCGFCTLYFLSEPLVRLLGVPVAQIPTASAILPWYCGTSLFVALITPIFSAVITAFNRYDIGNVLRTATSLIPPFVALPILSSSNSPLFVWCAVTCGSQLAFLGCTAFAAISLCRRLVDPSAAVLSLEFWNTVRFGLNIFATQFCSMLGSQSDTWAISAFKGASELAFYNPASRVAALSRPFVAVLANTLQTTATARYVTGDHNPLSQLLLRGTRYQMLLGSLVFACLVSCSFDFCRLWVGKSLGTKYTVVASLLIAMACVDLLEYAAGTQWPVLVGMRQVNYLLTTQIPFTALNIVLTIVLVAYSPLGAYGAILATAVANALRRPLICVYAAHACGLSARQYFRQSYLGPLLVGFCTTALGFLLAMATPSSNWCHLAGRVVAIGCAWAIFVALIGLTSEERLWLRQHGLVVVSASGHRAQIFCARVWQALGF